LLRKLILANAAYKRWVASGHGALAADFVVDAMLLPSPYALSFGGFVNLHTSLWFGGGGIVTGVFDSVSKRFQARGVAEGEVLPSDMSSTSLFGGGLIAGDALAALGIGIVGLVSTLSGKW